MIDTYRGTWIIKNGCRIFASIIINDITTNDIISTTTKVGPYDNLQLHLKCPLSYYSLFVSSFRRFFIAWNGVATLAYTGFPTHIEATKATINKEVVSLKSENAGSKWPKSTLGCLYDDRVLTIEQLQCLYDICHDISRQFDAFITPHPTVSSPISFSSMSIVLMANRSLQQLIYRTDIPLQSSARRKPMIPRSHHHP
jgi:hypothetical protein